MKRREGGRDLYQQCIVESLLHRHALHLTVVYEAQAAVLKQQDVTGMTVAVEHAAGEDFIAVHLA